MSAPTVQQVFTDLFNAVLAIIDQIALAIQSNAALIAMILIIGSVVGAVYAFGRRLVGWFRGFLG